MNHIHHKLLINAPAREVYEAITSQAGLAGWWTPGAEAQPEVNTVARFHFGGGYFKEMKITSLIPSKEVKWNCITGASEWIGTSLLFELKPCDATTIADSFPEMTGQAEQAKSGTGTILTFHHDNWKAYTPMFAECSYTWGQFLKSLKLLCETGKGKPWPDQHR